MGICTFRSQTYLCGLGGRYFVFSKTTEEASLMLANLHAELLRVGFQVPWDSTDKSQWVQVFPDTPAPPLMGPTEIPIHDCNDTGLLVLGGLLKPTSLILSAVTHRVSTAWSSFW